MPLCQVQWDEPASVSRPERVSAWEIEPFVASVPTSLVQPVAVKNKRLRPTIEIPASSAASVVWNPHDSTQLSGIPEEHRSENPISWFSPSDLKASRNMLFDEKEDSKSPSAWSVLPSYSTQHSAIQTNEMPNGRKSDTVASCRLFGFDLKVPSNGDSSVNTATYGTAVGPVPSTLSAGESEQKSNLSKDSKEGLLQVSTKEAQSKQTCSTRSRTKVYVYDNLDGESTKFLSLDDIPLFEPFICI